MADNAGPLASLAIDPKALAYSNDEATKRSTNNRPTFNERIRRSISDRNRLSTYSPTTSANEASQPSSEFEFFGDIRRSSLRKLYINIKDKIESIVKSRRVSSATPSPDENIEGGFNTNKFELDLPQYISRDKSELDYLRRINSEYLFPLCLTIRVLSTIYWLAKHASYFIVRHRYSQLIVEGLAESCVDPQSLIDTDVQVAPYTYPTALESPSKFQEGLDVNLENILGWIGDVQNLSPEPPQVPEALIQEDEAELEKSAAENKINTVFHTPQYPKESRKFTCCDQHLESQHPKRSTFEAESENCSPDDLTSARERILSKYRLASRPSDHLHHPSCDSGVSGVSPMLELRMKDECYLKPTFPSRQFK
jgi:hypothetical protein